MDFPPAYQRYETILARLGPGRYEGDGLTFKCLYPERHKNGDRTPSLRIFMGKKDGALFARCMGCGATHDEIVKAVGLPVSAWFPQGADQARAKSPPAKFVCSYPYHDEGGRVIAVKSRYEPGWHGAKKSFLWRREVRDRVVREAVHAAPNEVVFAFSLEAGSYRVSKRDKGRIVLEKAAKAEPGVVELASAAKDVSLYNLHEIAKAAKTIPIVVVEGEKDADNLTKLGFLATTGYAGKGKWEPGWANAFRGRRVVVCPDVDRVDEVSGYATKVAADCLWHEAAEVRIVRLPVDRLKPGAGCGDISDFLASAVGDPKKAVIDVFSQTARYVLKGADCPHNAGGRK